MYTQTSNIKSIDSISTEDSVIIVRQWMGCPATVNVSDTHLRTLARNILRSRKYTVQEALDIATKQGCRYSQD